MKRILQLCFTITTLIICSSAVFQLCACDKKDYNKVFYNNWGIVLPEGMSKVFSKADDTWHGEGVRYAVFTLDEIPADFISDFSKEYDYGFVNRVNELLGNAKFDLPQEFLPKWENNFYWKSIEEIANDTELGTEIVESYCYFIFFPSEIKLCICQYFN